MLLAAGESVRLAVAPFPPYRDPLSLITCITAT